MRHGSVHDHGLRAHPNNCVVLTLTVALAGLAVALLIGDSGAADAQASSVAATRKTQDASSAGSRAVLYSVAFADAAHGWVVGAKGDCSGSQSGGVILTMSK